MKPLAAALPAVAALATGVAVSVPALSVSSADISTSSTCQTEQLQPSLASEQGATGQLQMVVALRNVSTSPCVLSGYPGLQLFDAGGRPLPTRVVHGGTHGAAPAPHDVVVQPAGTASFAVAYSHIPGSTGTSCPTAQRLGITPPGSDGRLPLEETLDPCGGVLHVSPVASGAAAG